MTKFKMTVFDDRWTMPGVAKEMRRRAKLGVWSGPESTSYLSNCSARHQPTGTTILFSRDMPHSPASWSNPDYKRCWHLSLSFVELGFPDILDRDMSLTQGWIDQFFGDHQHLIWVEPPSSEKGKRNNVWHYRLFVEPDWETPLPSLGQVKKEEWKLWTDVQAEE